MNLLADIKTFFVANGIKETIYLDAIGDRPDTAIVLYEYQGVNPVPQIAGANRPVQVLVRASTVAESKSLCGRLYKLLRSEDSIFQFTEDRWAMVHLNHTPFKLKVDESGRTSYIFNTLITTYFE